MEHYIHTLDLAEFYTRRQRFGAELLRKIEPISQAAIYQKRAHKDTDKLLEVVRSNYKQKTRRGVVVADEGTSGEAVSSGFQQLTALYTFLSRAAGMDESAIESLGNEYEYGFDRASRYVKVAKFICGLTTGWRGTSRFKIPENALVPSWRLSETEENNMAVVAEAAYGLIAADKRRVQEVCHDYIHRVCSRNGIIYGRKSELAAQAFIDFIRDCDIPLQQIQLAFYRGGAAIAKSAWLKAFNLRKKCMIDEIVPSNVNSDALKNSVRIKVLMEAPGNYPKASQTRFLNLLMFLVGVEVLECELD